MMHESKGQHIGKAPSLHLFHSTVKTVHGSRLPKMYHKLPWDEAKTMPCILQHYHKSALTVARLLHTSGTTYRP